MNPLNYNGYQMIAKLLKLALDKGGIHLNDFLKTDGQLIEKVRHSKEKDVQDLLGKLHPNVKVVEDVTKFDLHLKNKVRIIDPSVLVGNELTRASQLSDAVLMMNEEAYNKAVKGMYVKIILN